MKIKHPTITSFCLASIVLTTSNVALAQTTPAATGTQVSAVAAVPAPVPSRYRGEIIAIDATSVTIKERSGAEMTFTLADNLPVSEIKPIALADIKANSYIGTAAMPKADGSLEALELLLFPEAARGTGEGHFPWDLKPQSTMTNATVAAIQTTPSGSVLRLTYKGQEKTVSLLDTTPIVTTLPADKSLLVVGAKVLIVGITRDGKLIANRISAGRNGFTPPM